MAAVVSVISRRGYSIDVHCRKQPNTSKLDCYFCFNSLVTRWNISVMKMN